MIRIMFEDLVGYLNNLRAGDVLNFLVVMGCAGSYVFDKLKKWKSQHKAEVEEEIKKASELEQLTTKLKNTHDELETVKVSMEQLQKLVREHIEGASTNSESVQQSINELGKMLVRHGQKIDSLEKCIDKVECQIDLLFKSDKEYFRAYIMEGYNKYVKGEKCIDLMSLQSLENIYNKYLEEDGERDEFLAKLMRELRNLPTTKDKKKE